MVLLAGSSVVLGGEKVMTDRDGIKEYKGDVTHTEIPGIAADQLPDPKSAGAGLLLRYCTQCHNLPGPATHSLEEWPEVVTRMDHYMGQMAGKGHREMMRIKQPTETEREIIKDYLKTNALKPF